MIPWQARIISILVSQAGLCLAQYLAWDAGGGAWAAVVIAGLQAIQGSIASYGLGSWSAAAKLARAIRGTEKEDPK